MRKATAATRLAVLKGAAVAGVLVTAALFTGTAGAAVITVPIGPNAATNGANLASAITTANTNGGSNTIVIGSGSYDPAAQLPAITDPNLTITGNHATQNANGLAPIIGGANDTTDQPLLVISAGGGLTTEGIDFRGIGVGNGSLPAIDDAGTLTAYDTAFQANSAEATLQVDSTGTATLTESLVVDNGTGTSGYGIDNEAGTVNLNFDTIARNDGGLLNNGTTNATNTIFAANAGNVALTNCSVGQNLASSAHIVDTDGTCVAPGDTTSKTGTTAAPLAQTLGQGRSNGGPTVTVAIPSTATSNPALGLANPAQCQLTDQRFFVHTGTSCDAGSYQDNGTQDTTPPACPGPGVITQNGSGQNVSQQITVTDPASGLGPEGGLVTDIANAQQSPAVTLGNDQADIVDGVTIDNGTVAATGFSPSGYSTSPVQVTATKTTVGTVTHWSFYATDWAGVTLFCH